MKSEEPLLFRWIREDVVRYWKIMAAIPIVYGLAMSLYNVLSYEYFSLLILFSMLLGQVPDVLVYLLLIKYLRLKESAPATAQRLSIEIAPQGAPVGSVREFFWAALIRWACCYAVVWVVNFQYGGFFFYSIVDCLVTVASYSFALREARLVMRHDSYDGASRLLASSVLFFCLLGLTRAGYFFFFGYGSFINLFYVLLSFVMSILILFYEQRRYLLAQALYRSKDPTLVIEPLDPLNPPQGLLPLAYWPEVNLDGVLSRIERSGSKDDPFRSNEMKVPLFIVPLQAEPFMSLLGRRLYGFIALLLVSLYFLFEHLA